ncbi:MAG: universal stress protein [Thermoanaerobaculum sp.]|nr:universal stress protein [Thermoanaerobaculum sp.]MDW7968543.1 universal stress protein [Thermoanaerobaculum sp.]
MIKHMVVGLDGSTFGAAAEQFAISLAKKLGACLHGAHVLDTAFVRGAFVSDISGAMGFEPFLRLQAQVEQSLRELADLLKDRFVGLCEQQQVPHRFALLHGAVAEKLCEEAASTDLLVLGQRGTAAASHPQFLGSTSARLLRRCPVPLLLVPERAQLPQKPLVAFDGSPKAFRALHLAGELCAALGVPLKVVTLGNEQALASQRLEQASHFLEPFQVKATFHWEQGEAVEQVLLAMLDPAEHDFLFMGAHGHSRVIETVLGSTTEYITRRAPVPVLCATRA